MPRRRSRGRGRRSRRRSRRRSLSPMALLVTGVVVGAAIFVGFVVWTLRRPQVEGETQAAVCVIVLDRTASASDAERTASFRDHGITAVNGCADRKARTSIFYFDQSTQQLTKALTAPVDLWLPTDRKVAAQESKLNQAKKVASDAVVAVYDRDPAGSGGSDLLGALRDAAQDLNGLAAQSGSAAPLDRYLVVVTDGIQYSTDVTAEHIQSRSTSIDPMVETARDLHLIPDLRGAKVTFVGVRGRASGDHTYEYFDAKLEEFWEAIVTEGGGQLCEYAAALSTLPSSDCERGA